MILVGAFVIACRYLMAFKTKGVGCSSAEFAGQYGANYTYLAFRLQSWSGKRNGQLSGRARIPLVLRWSSFLQEDSGKLASS